MEELEIVIEKENNNEIEIILEQDIIIPDAKELTVTPSEEEQQFSGLYKTVNVEKIPDEYIIPTGTLDITESGEYDVKTYEKANVNAGANFEITKCGYLFYSGQRVEVLNEMLSLIKKPTTLGSMFVGCSTITDLDLSCIDGSEAIYVNGIFMGTDNVTNLKWIKNIGKGFTKQTMYYNSYDLVITMSKLTHESLMDVINNIYDLNLTYKALGSALYSQKLTLGSTNKAKLTAEEIAIATSKGWTVA